jgi:hypothetical protein
MGSKAQPKAIGAQKMQPGVMRAQKGEIQISRLKKILYLA